MAEFARQRNSEQSATEQFDRHCVRYVASTGLGSPALMSFSGDYYFVEAGNQLLEMNITTCDGTVSPNATVAPSGSPSATGTTDHKSSSASLNFTPGVTLLAQCALFILLVV